MARISGFKGQVSMDAAGGSSYTAVASLNKWTLNMSKDKFDVTCFGDTNKQKVVGLADYTGTFGGIWDSATTPTVFDAVLGSIAVGLKLTPSTLEPTFFFSGLAYLDGSIDVNANGAITIAGTFDAASNWTMAP